MGAGAELLLFDCQLAHAATGTAGKVNLSLTALSDGLLQTSLAPVQDPDQGLASSGSWQSPTPLPLMAPGPEQAPDGDVGPIPSLRSLRIRTECASGPEAGCARKSVSTSIAPMCIFRLAGAPVYGLGEGAHTYDLTGINRRDEQRPAS